jgi:hydrogenase maturation protease
LVEWQIGGLVSDRFPNLPVYQSAFEGDMALKTLVLGLGNPILTDDGVGIHVVRVVQSRISGSQVPISNLELFFVEASVGGLRLLDVLAGYERVIIVDAIQTHDGRPGDVHRLHADDLRASLHSSSTHDLTLSGALALGRHLGMALPEDQDLVILAVEVEDVLTFGEECTPGVRAAIPGVVQMILDELAPADPGRVDP